MLQRQKFRFIAMLFVFCSISTAALNSITITEAGNVSTANYPVQIGRPFGQAEIMNFPRAAVNGTPVTTQADVKQRWSDGSVKHAVLTFLIPNLAAKSTVTVTFQNQATGNNTGFLNTAGMLDAAYDFDASINLTDTLKTRTLTASARDMITNGKFDYWLKGSVATSIILADHSVSRTFDMGFDSHKSFRPIFHATFYPGVKKVRVRFIGEICNSEALQDMVYFLALKLGQSVPELVYSQDSITVPTSVWNVSNRLPFTHTAKSRWTREFWIGGTPSRIGINPNLKYLAANKFLPNYDTTIVLATGHEGYDAIIARYDQSKTKFYDHGGLWQMEMQAVGGRPDIGPYPTWTLHWLYGGNPLLQMISFRLAELSAAWTVHVREGQEGRYIDREHRYPALGRPLSIYARPTFAWNPANWMNAADKVIPVGPVSDNRWRAEVAHTPEANSPQYLLSGDYWFFEEMCFWPSWSTFFANTRERGGVKYGTQPPVARLYHYQVRGEAWQFRLRANCAFLAPDSAPEKPMMTSLTEDAIACWEGEKDIHGSSYENSTPWTVGHDYAVSDRWAGHGPSPLHFWGRIEGTLGSKDPYYGGGIPAWQQNMVIFSLGWAREMGFKTDSLLKWAGVNLIHQLANPSINHFLCAGYYMPTVNFDGTWLQSWHDVNAAFMGFDSRYDTLITSWPDPGVDYQYMFEHSYHMIARCAASYITRYTDKGLSGQDAWDWINSKTARECLDPGGNPRSMAQCPKWCILPRTETMSAVEQSADATEKSGITASPNPFNPATLIRVSGIGKAGQVVLQIYNLQGRLIEDFNTTASTLTRGILWDAKKYSSGVYVLKALVKGKQLSRKLVLVK